MLDQTKLKALVLYMAKRMELDDHAGRGRIKLAKLVWLSDFEAHRRLGHSITGSRYVADELGPVVEGELLLIRDLEASGDLVLEPGYDRQQLLRTQRPADTSPFPKDELAVIDEMLDKYRTWTGKRLVDDVAHKFPGWVLAKRDHEIPYHTVHISKDGPNSRDTARAQELARGAAAA